MRDMCSPYISNSDAGLCMIVHISVRDKHVETKHWVLAVFGSLDETRHLLCHFTWTIP